MAEHKKGGGAKKYGRNCRAGKFGGRRRSPKHAGARKKSAGTRKGNYPVKVGLPPKTVRAYEVR